MATGRRATRTAGSGCRPSPTAGPPITTAAGTTTTSRVGCGSPAWTGDRRGAAGRPLPRVRITDLLQTVESGAASPRQKETARSGGIDRVLEARRAGEQAASETKGAQSRGGLVPARVPVVRPNGLIRALRRGAAAADTADAGADGGRR